MSDLFNFPPTDRVPSSRVELRFTIQLSHRNRLESFSNSLMNDTERLPVTSPNIRNPVQSHPPFNRIARVESPLDSMNNSPHDIFPLTSKSSFADSLTRLSFLHFGDIECKNDLAISSLSSK